MSVGRHFTFRLGSPTANFPAVVQVKVRVDLRKLVWEAPGLAAEALGLEPESDEAEKRLQELRDSFHDEQLVKRMEVRNERFLDSVRHTAGTERT